VPSLAVAVEGHGRVDLPGGTEMEQFYQASAADSIIHGLGDRSISVSLHLFLFPTGYFSVLIINLFVADLIFCTIDLLVSALI
jgi:hypothetical protein